MRQPTQAIDGARVVEPWPGKRDAVEHQQRGHARIGHGCLPAHIGRAADPANGEIGTPLELLQAIDRSQ
jgi:hypothetical protein